MDIILVKILMSHLWRALGSSISFGRLKKHMESISVLAVSRRASTGS